MLTFAISLMFQLALFINLLAQWHEHRTLHGRRKTEHRYKPRSKETRMDKSRRKELTRDYTDRKQPIGVYAVRCAASGEVWVGGTKNLDKRWNAISFSANAGGAPEASLQAAWKKHGAGCFSYEILEAFDETNEHTLKTLLPERTAIWRRKLDALPLMGV